MNGETLIPRVGVVTEVRIDTPDIKNFRVVGTDGKKPFVHKPGQCAMISLPGIGEVIAQRIIDYRELCGRFLDPEQLMEVDGIGQAKYEKLRELVTVRNTE